MKKLILFIGLFAIYFASFGQDSNGDYRFIRLGDTFYSDKSGDIDTLITFHPDSAGQYKYKNASDPIDELDVVNLRYFANNALLSPTDSILFNTILASSNWKEGKLFWDNSKHALSYYNEASQVTVNLGQEGLKRALNNTGVTIPDNTPVYLSNGEFNFGRNTLYDESRLIGVSTHDILNGEYGYATVWGDQSGDFVSMGFSQGDIIYLGDSVLTNVAPSGEEYIVRIGEVQNDSILFVLPQVGEHTQEMINYTGWPSPTNVTIGLNSSTRTITLTPTSGNSFYHYQDGKKYIIASDSFTWPDTEGLHSIYYNNGSITETITPTESEERSIITNNPGIVHIYWDALNDTVIYANNEFHSFDVNGQTKAMVHDIHGCTVLSGLGLTNFDADGSGDVASNAQFGNNSGIIRNTDIITSIPSTTSTTGYTIFYKSGVSDWRSLENAGYSVLTTGTGRLAYNENVGGSYQLTEATNNYYVPYYVLVSNTLLDKIGTVPSENEYSTLDAAITGSINGLANLLSNLPLKEISKIGIVYYQTRDVYTNVVKSRIVSITNPFSGEAADYLDLTTQSISGGGAGSLTTNFIDLNDVFSSYSGRTNDIVVVNGTADGLTSTPTITASKISDFDTEVANNSAVSANTGKDTTGIYHANRSSLDLVSGTNTGDVTLTGTGDYLSLSSQQLTKSLIDTLSTHINKTNWDAYVDGRITASGSHPSASLSSDDTGILDLNAGTQAFSFVSSNLAKLNQANTFTDNIQTIYGNTNLGRLYFYNGQGYSVDVIRAHANGINVYSLTVDDNTDYIYHKTDYYNLNFQSGLGKDIQFYGGGSSNLIKLRNGKVIVNNTIDDGSGSWLQVSGSINSTGYKLNSTDLLLDAHKSGSLGTAGQIYTGAGATSTPTWTSPGSINISGFNNDANFTTPETLDDILANGNSAPTKDMTVNVINADSIHANWFGGTDTEIGVAGSELLVSMDSTRFIGDVDTQAAFKKQGVDIINSATVLQRSSNSFNFAHGTCQRNDEMYIGTYETGATIYKFTNPDNLESYTSQAIAGVDYISQLVYDSSNDMIYASANDEADNTLIIVEIDPDNLASYSLHDTGLSGQAGGIPSICTDGSYVYGVTWASTSLFFKMSVSTWAAPTTNTWTSRPFGHAAEINTSRNEFYVTSKGGYFAVVSTTDLSFSEVFIDTYGDDWSDDIAIVDDGTTCLVFCGSETYQANRQGGVIVETTNSNAVYPINLLPSYGMFTFGDGLVYSTGKDGYIQIIPANDTLLFDNIITYRLEGYIPNELFTADNGRLFFTNWGTGVGALVEFVTPSDYRIYNPTVAPTTPTLSQVLTQGNTSSDFISLTGTGYVSTSSSASSESTGLTVKSSTPSTKLLVGYNELADESYVWSSPRLKFGTSFTEQMSISTAGEVFMENIDAATSSNIIYYDTSTKELTYGAAPAGSGTVTSVALSSSDLTISGSPITISGTITANLASASVDAGNLNNNVISGQTELASGLESTDEFLISDAGTIKRMDMSVIDAYLDQQRNAQYKTTGNFTGTSFDFTLAGSNGTEVQNVRVTIELHNAGYTRYGSFEYVVEYLGGSENTVWTNNVYVHSYAPTYTNTFSGDFVNDEIDLNIAPAISDTYYYTITEEWFVRTD